MNDFTKEDLQYLHACIYERPNSVTPEMNEMRDKLQSLVDNYCEHKHQIECADCETKRCMHCMKARRK